jgi:uncharacterized protein
MIASCGAFCLGFSKAGFPGMALVNVVLMAELFGAKESVGMILPLLILCDFAVFPLFAHYATWKETWPLFFVAAMGVFLGYTVLDYLNAEMTKTAIGIIVLTMLALQLARQSRPLLFGPVEGARWFRWWSGLLIGVSTMIANAAAPAYSIYTLANRFSKEQFLGIGARCFLLINLLKAPLMTNLEIINRKSLIIDAMLIPGLALGVLAGKLVIHRIPQKVFEQLLYLFSAIAGIRLVFF